MGSLNNKQKRWLARIITAGALYAAVIIFQNTGPADSEKYPWLSFALYMIPYLIVGYDVLKKAFVNISHGQVFDENFLMMIATFGALGVREYSEAVAVMLFYQVGELFQNYAVERSRKSITDLMNIVPQYANLEVGGKIIKVDPDGVDTGSTIVIMPGERVPLDGIVIEGTSMLDTAALTGESVPRKVSDGSDIISGCVNGSGTLRVRTTSTFEDSTVSRILELVEDASSRKAKTENFITRFARVYTPVVVFSAIALALIPPIFVGHWLTWIYRACTFLVISCPCALVISVPLAFFGGIGAASKNGVLVKGSNYLETIANLSTVVSDKTGTLTKGVFKVNHIENAKDEHELLRLASLAESMSTHPIATSIKEAYGEKIDASVVKDITNVAGQGVICDLGDHQIYVGSTRLMKEHGINYIPAKDHVSTTVYVGRDQEFLGSISISDEIKPTAKEAISEMKHSGVKNVVMLTGDNQDVAEAVGKELGVDHIYAQLLPADKVSRVEELLKETDEKHTLAFIGDGINDAPVLARADVGIAMGSLGSDAAIEAADVVIMDDDLLRIPTIIRIGRKTLSISNENIVFSIFIKVLTLILGAVGIANMWMAVFADVGVAVIAILNSMRTLKAK